MEQKGSYLDAEIYNQDAEMAVHYQQAASLLRNEGIAVEVFPDAVKMGKQYAVTEKKCIPWGILISREEAESGKMTLKNLQTREQFSGLSAKEAAQKILGNR